jgi:hypothetical protein
LFDPNFFTCVRSGKLFDEEAGVEGPDGERGAAFVPEQDEPTDADAVGVQELRLPAPQERTLAVPAHLHAPDLAERAHDEGCGHARSVLLAAAGSCVEGIGKLVGDALVEKQEVGLISSGSVASGEWRPYVFNGEEDRQHLPACGRKEA